MITIYFDGASSPRKKDSAGWGIVMMRDGEEKMYACDRLPGDTTNNQAEMYGLIEALKLAHTQNGIVDILGDSKNAISWTLGFMKCKNEGLKPLVEKARTLLLPRIKLGWIPRKENKADEWAHKGKILR